MTEKPKATADTAAGEMIPDIKPGSVFTWLGERIYLAAIIRVCNSFLNLVLNVNITLPDGTSIEQKKIRPKIANGSASIDLDLDLSQSGLSMTSGGQTVIPFQFYNITNSASAADTWRTVQMRNGIVGWRSKYRNEAFEQSVPRNSDTRGNGELRSIIVNEAAAGFFGQPTALATQTTLDDTAEVVLYDPTISLDSAGQILLNSANPDGSGNVLAGFWLEIMDGVVVDSVLSSYVVLKGRMFSPLGTGGRVTTAFPAMADNIIPLAIVQANATLDPQIFQIQTGNCVNRYPPGTTRDRGAWTADALANRYFFTGDEILDDSSVNRVIGTQNFYARWRYTGYGQVTQPPSTDPTNWTKLYAVPAAT